MVTFAVVENGSLPAGATYAALSSPEQIGRVSALEGVSVGADGQFAFEGTGYYITIRNVEHARDRDPGVQL